MRKKMSRIVMIVVFILSLLTGCELLETTDEKVKDLDYTICEESRLPAELNEIIRKKKKEPFKLTYRTKEYLYIVVGYGAQDRKDLNVVMSEFYLTDNAIYVDTDLVAEEDKKIEGGKVAYPWIAVKCELYDTEVIFK